MTRSPDDPWEDEEERTTVDDRAFVEAADAFDALTPVDVASCHDCGAVVVLDDFNDVSLHAYPSHCMRARTGKWSWRAKFRKAVTYVPE